MGSSILSWLQRSDIVKFDVETAIPCLVCIKAFRLNPLQVHNSTSTWQQSKVTESEGSCCNPISLRFLGNKLKHFRSNVAQYLYRTSTFLGESSLMKTKRKKKASAPKQAYTCSYASVFTALSYGCYGLNCLRVLKLERG